MKKNVLVVGGASSIGNAVIQLLIDKGDRVLSLCRKESSPEPIKEADPLIGNPITGSFPTFEEPLHGLVYCPGTITLKPFQQLKIEEFEHDLNVNYLGAVKTVQHFLPNLQQVEKASLVFISTVAVQKGFPFHTSIAGAKGALEGFARSLAADLAPKIRVNIVAPSLTDTPLAEALLKDEKKREHNAKRHPLQSIGEPEDIAQGIAYFLSDDSKWVTGQTLGIDGGLSSIQFI